MFHSIPFLMMLAVTGLHCQMDEDFCADNAPPPANRQPLPFPELSHDMTLTYERTFLNKNESDTTFMIYSLTSQKIYQEYRNLNIERKKYIDIKQMESLSITNNTCESHPLYGSMEQNLFPIVFDGNALVLKPMKYPLLGYSESGDPHYIDKATVRGIPANQWHVCLYSPWNRLTSSANFFFNSDDVEMPGSSQTVPLKIEIVTSSNVTGEVQRIRIDIVDFNTNITKEDEIRSEIPVNDYCSERPVAHNLPIPRSVFTFKSESIDIDDPRKSPRPEPRISHFKKTYVKDMGIFYVESEIVSPNRTVTEHRVLQDFSSGLEYDLDLSQDVCTIRPIDVALDHVSSSSSSDVTKMESPQEFFDLSPNNFHYMGEHKCTDRGIDVDVFTSLLKGGPTERPGNVIHIWYFASKHWMLNVMGFKEYFLLPVRYRIGTTDPSSDKSLDIYGFSTRPSDKSTHPDMTACFPQGKKMHVKIALHANPKQLMAKCLTVQRDFRNALLNVSSLRSTVRINKLKVVPDGVDTTIMSFSLLDKPIMAEHGAAAAAGRPSHEGENEELTSVEVYRRLEHAINNGTFVVHFHTSVGIQRVKAVGIDTFQEHTFTREPGKNKSRSKDYSEESFIFLGVGAFILGIVLGVVVVKVVKTVRQARTKRRRSVGWQNLIKNEVTLE